MQYVQKEKAQETLHMYPTAIRSWMLSYATELLTQRGNWPGDGVGGGASEYAEKVRGTRPPCLNLTPEMAKQIAPYIKIINNMARLEDPTVY